MIKLIILTSLLASCLSSGTDSTSSETCVVRTACPFSDPEYQTVCDDSSSGLRHDLEESCDARCTCTVTCEESVDSCQ